jgi:WhiB family redox-sensing transcriptional regulator
MDSATWTPRREESALPIDRRPRRPINEEWDWQGLAACRGMDVEIFFHPYDERRQARELRIRQAKVICQDCPVVTECRDHALSTREPYGIWGGLSEGERALLLGVRNLRHPALRRHDGRHAGPPAEGITGPDRPLVSHRFGLGGTD